MKLADLIPAGLKDEEVVKASDVARWLGVTTQTLIIWSAAGRLPARLQLGPRTNVYRIGELRAALVGWETQAEISVKERA